MDQGNATDERLSRDVLVLGGANPGSIGAAIYDRLLWMGHQPTAPAQEYVDVTTEEGMVNLLDILHMFKPDAVVYSVGVNELEWSGHLTRESFDRIMGINVWGFLNVMKTLQATGLAYSVLAITSDAAVRPMRTSAIYCASKAALNMAIKVTARELTPEGWRINGLAPGKVEGTDMTKYVDDRVMEIRDFSSKAAAERYEMAGNPLGRKLYTAEVAAAACDILLSYAMGWSGDIITVNGGR